MKTLTVPAELEQLDTVLTFIADELEQADCPMKSSMQVQMAAEEIFVNIASYAYQPKSGMAEVRCEVSNDPLQVSLQFLDSGTPFDPLMKADADTTLPVEDREVGGLGILLVKKTMDQVHYAYENGKNILTIEKKL